MVVEVRGHIDAGEPKALAEQRARVPPRQCRHVTDQRPARRRTAPHASPRADGNLRRWRGNVREIDRVVDLVVGWYREVIEEYFKTLAKSQGQ